MIEKVKYKLERFCKNPWRITKVFAQHGWLSFLSDKAYLSTVYHANLGKRLDWANPKSYNEKLQWLKLYDRNPLYPKMVDKYEAKQYIANRVGSQYVPQVIGGPWKHFDDIDFTVLPKRFVLKTTHDCGGVWICTNKDTLDLAAAKRFLNKHLKDNYYKRHREWPYRDIEPRIFAEEYLEDLNNGELRDYKFFTFDGIPKMMFIASERQSKETETKFDFFDMDYHHLPFVQGHPNSKQKIEKPVHFEKMKELAGVLSKGTPQLRVDFFECNGSLYVGEMTFFHYAGLVPFEPQEWDTRVGNWLTLPEKR